MIRRWPVCAALWAGGLLSGCGLVLDLDPDVRQPALDGGDADAGGRRDGAVADAGAPDAGPAEDAATADASGPDGGVDPAAAIAAGTLHTCALLASGRVACWGQNTDGQVGAGTVGTRVEPSEVPGLDGVAGVDAAFQHTCAFRTGGRALCWGSAMDGRLGNMSSSGMALAPTGVVGLSTVVSIATGTSHTCAALTSGVFACWGRGAEGQLGNGSGSSATVPVSGYVGSAVVAVTAGQSHSCARGADGSAFCWGSGSLGQLGDGTTVSSGTPKTVLLTEVAQIDAGDHHTCARTTSGEVFCFGNNADGRVSPAGTPGALVSTPTRVAVSSAVDVSAGGSHTCAVHATGEVSCWGANGFGQLGVGSTDPVGVVVAVTDLHDAVDVSSGAQHTCVIRRGGEVACWGNNGSGQLGVPSLEPHTAPVDVPLP